MTIWTPKTPGGTGIITHWHPENDGMWEKSNILAYSTQIKQVRLIHMENVYRYMWHYLTENMWEHPHKGKRFEEFYGEYRDQEDHKEIRFWWRMERNPGGIAGGHSYFKQKLFVDCLTTGMKRVEIVHNGQKIKPYVGEFLLWVNSVLVLDKNGWFSGDNPHWLGKILGEWWPRMIYKDRVREQEVELRRETERFVEDVKYYIGLNRYDKVRRPSEDDKQWF